MRRKAAAFALVVSFALLGFTSPAGAASAQPVGSTVGAYERTVGVGAAQSSSPRNPELFTIIAFIRRELTHPARLAAHWRSGLSS